MPPSGSNSWCDLASVIKKSNKNYRRKNLRKTSLREFSWGEFLKLEKFFINSSKIICRSMEKTFLRALVLRDHPLMATPPIPFYILFYFWPRYFFSVLSDILSTLSLAIAVWGLKQISNFSEAQAKEMSCSMSVFNPPPALSICIRISPIFSTPSPQPFVLASCWRSFSALYLVGASS